MTALLASLQWTFTNLQYRHARLMLHSLFTPHELNGCYKMAFLHSICHFNINIWSTYMQKSVFVDNHFRSAVKEKALVLQPCQYLLCCHLFSFFFQICIRSQILQPLCKKSTHIQFQKLKVIGMKTHLCFDPSFNPFF